MKVDDPLWKAIFGTDDSQLEPPPTKTKPRRLSNCQREAKQIVTKPELFGRTKPAQRQLFEDDKLT